MLKNKKGLTLLEILVSIAILALVVMPLLGMFLSAYQTNAASQRILSGTYIAQSVLEDCKSMDYVELAELSGSTRPHDSDGDGDNDCYVKIMVYPEGSPAGVSSDEKATCLQITYLADYIESTGVTVDTVHVLGDDGSYSSFQAQADASYTLNWAGGNRLELKNDQSGSLLASFMTKNAAYPLVIIANTRQKTFGYNNTLKLSPGLKIQYNATVVLYSNEFNIDELICSDLQEENIIFGINDYTTALVHLKVTAFYDSAGTEKLGEIEESIKVKVQ